MLAGAVLAQQARRPAQRDTTRAAGDSARVEYWREVFGYSGGTRDPFRSLITPGSNARLTIADLRLVAVAYDARYGNSVAIVREANNPRPHRLRRGDQVGRLRVVQIRQYEVVFQIEEFGLERQEVLSLPRPEAMFR